jgi:lipoprotein-anchoring transpeptidase ErfK/SrfK
MLPHRSPLLFSLCIVAALSACQSRPVSVVTPEIEPDIADLAPLSTHGDTSWRISAIADLRMHTISAPGPSVASAAPKIVSAIPAPVTPPATPTATHIVGAAPATGFAAISPETVNAEPSDDMLAADDGPGVLRAQVLLDRAHFSPGVINGKAGQNVEKAIYFFQEQNGLTPTGRLDRATYDKLVEADGRMDGVVKYTLTEDDVAGPYYWVPSSVYEQAQLPCECYASALEMLDERFHTVTDVLRKLNPGFGFVSPKAGAELWVPNVEPFNAETLIKTENVKPIVKIHIAKDGRYLQALAADGSIVFHFPTTVGSEYDPSPSGVYHVQGVLWHPVFHYDPTLYSDVPDSRPKATLPPGPNSPVGIVWIATTKEHVGIHGTPLPHTIGLASSHGCVRLTNWDAARLAGAIRDGVRIEFGN